MASERELFNIVKLTYTNYDFNQHLRNVYAINKFSSEIFKYIKIIIDSSGRIFQSHIDLLNCSILR